MMKLDIITTQSLSLTTNRLQLTLMNREHLPQFKQLQCDPQLMQFIGPMLSDSDVQKKFDDRIKPWQQQENHWLTLMIHDKSTDQFIGSIGFRVDSIECQRVEIGYLALNNAQGKGYITEAGSALIHYLFEQVQVRKIIAHCATVNTASCRVMEKLLLKREGLLRSDFQVNDIWYDSYAYGLLNPIYNR
ncbi:GNAT family N-acetyltransferase [Colwelliaceae bacterium 6471]